MAIRSWSPSTSERKRMCTAALRAGIGAYSGEPSSFRTATGRFGGRLFLNFSIFLLEYLALQGRLRIAAKNRCIIETHEPFFATVPLLGRIVCGISRARGRPILSEQRLL